MKRMKHLVSVLILALPLFVSIGAGSASAEPSEYYLYNNFTVSFADVKGADYDDGTPALAWGLNYSANQRWRVERESTSRGSVVTFSNTRYRYEYALDENLSNHQVGIWRFHGYNNQRWYEYNDNTGRGIKLRNVSSGRCLVAPARGAQLETWTCDSPYYGLYWAYIPA